MSIESSVEYKSAVYAPTREVRGRVTINMDSFSQASPNILTGTSNYVNKISGSVVKNANVYKANASNTAPISPSSFTTEQAQASYDNIEILDGTTSSTSSTVNTQIPQQLFQLDIIQYLERKYGVNLWQNRTATLADKIVIAKNIVTRIKGNYRGRGTSPTGNKVTFTAYNVVGATYLTGVNHTNGAITLLELDLTTSLANYIDANGYVNFLAYGNASNGTTNGTILTDTVDFYVEITQTTVRTFDDSRIISADIIEELDILNVTSPANQLTIKLDNTDDLFNFIGLNNIQTLVASRPSFSIEYGVVLADGSEEWIPAGKFYMTDWKQDVGGMSVTFVCHDTIMILANSTFPIQPIANVGVALQSLLAGCEITDYVYDPMLDSLNLGNRPTRYTNCRTLLQNLCIGTGLTLYQDRYGTLRLEKFPPILQSLTYTTFTTSQLVSGTPASLFGGHVSSTVVGGQPKAISKQDTDGGMRSITLDQMFDIPQLTLEPSIYQITVNVYKNNPSDPSFDIYIYTNPAVSGTSGESFTLDNMLVTSTTTAEEIVNRFFTELNYNAVYVSRWRQNPVLEASDVIMINDSLTSAKQTRVTKQEFLYSGFLTGTTESRGGI